MTLLERNGSAKTRLTPPAPVVRLIGRETELEELFWLVLEPRARLTTITGAGGVGKTLLALHVAHEVQGRFDGGVLYAPLAGITDADLILPTLARLLDLSITTGEAEQRVIERLNGAPTLLVLDNLEHLPAAAGHLAPLLRSCPALTMLATSRRVLAMTGERRYPLRQLETPPAHATARELSESPAGELFVERAAMAGCPPEVLHAQAAAVAELCRWTEGLPLAIELAAARTGTFPPAALLSMGATRLETLTGGPTDAPIRLRSMEAAIAWSYDLLDEPAQRLFERLSHFEGGISLGGAQAMVEGWRHGMDYPMAGGIELDSWQPTWIRTGHESPEADGSWPRQELPPIEGEAWAVLDRLVAASLLQPTHTDGGDGRWIMLETLREFGLARLRERSELDAVVHAHARWALFWAEHCALHLWTQHQRVWSERVELDLPNFREAKRWLGGQPGAANQLSLRLAETLWPHWQMRGNPAEGRQWLRLALSRPGGSLTARSNCAFVAGILAWYQRDDEDAVAMHSRAAELGEAAGWLVSTGRATFGLALVAWRQEDWALMYALLTRAREILLEAESFVDAALCETALALLVSKGGHPAEALDLLNSAITRFRTHDFAWGLGAGHFYRGVVRHTSGNLEQAIRDLLEAIHNFTVIEDPWGIGGCLGELATIAAEAGDARVAARLLGASDGYATQTLSVFPPTEEERYRALAGILIAALGETEFRAEHEAGARLERPAAIALGRSLAGTVRGAPEPTEADRIRARLTPELFILLRLRASNPPQAIIHRRLAGIGKSQVYKGLETIREIFGVQDDGELLFKARALGIL